MTTAQTVGVGSVLVRVLAILLALLGAVLAAGGGWLAALGGSPYYLLAGAALVVSGILLYRLNVAGVWLYLAIVLGTVVWAVWEVGLDGWALVPRVVAPAILVIPVLLALPALRPHGGRLALRGLAGFVAFVALAAVIVGVANQAAPARPLSPALAGMSEPSVRNTGADWPAFGGTSSARRYSPLTQITNDNVGRLERAWTFRTGDLPKDKWGAETTPLKVGSSVYLCTGRSQAIALDAATGRQLWRFDPKVSDDWIPYTAACRGVAYYDVPQADPASACAARIIWGTLDGRLIAVDARTGRACADFGQGGAVDIKVGMGRVIPGMVSITSAPTIVRGVVVTGHQVLDGQSLDAPSGVVQGFDAVTGRQRWAWDMTRPDLTGYPPPGDSYTRGTPNMWTTATGDEQLGLVYLPMGNSAVDYLSGSRTPAENQYTAALVALDVTTGRPAWFFRTVHKDVWDYDLGSQASLVDFPTAAGPVPAVVLPSKQGDIYILDRRTGAPLTAVSQIRAPPGGVEPAQRTGVQPVSRYHTLRKANLTERDMWGMSPLDQLACRIGFRRAAYDGIYTPPTSKTHWIQYPGYNGGSDWGGVAIDPLRGLIIANYNDMPNHNRLIPRSEAERRGWFPRGDPRAKPAPEGAVAKGDPQGGAPYAIQVNAGWRVKFTGLLCKRPPYGGIRAIDLASGETVWDRPLGTARNNGPFGIASHLPLDIGTPNNGGSVVTAGGLVFIAAATDDLIRAIDIRTGKTVWSDVLPAGGQAAPIVYEQNGRQYLVIMAGGHHFMETRKGDWVIAYALPAR